MPIQRLRPAAGLLLALLAPPLAAQAPARPLDALVEEGLRANLGLVQARLADRRSALAVREARARLLPALDVDARWSEFDGVLDLGKLINPAFAALNRLTGTNAFPTDLDLTQPFKQDMRLRAVVPVFSPQAWAGYSASRHQRDAARARLGVTARDVAAGVQLAYLQFAAAARSVELLTGALALGDENVRTSERLVAAGTSTPDALYRARADRSATAGQLADAVRQRDAAARALNQLLQRPLTDSVPLFPDSLLVPDSAPALDGALAAARARREELAEADAAVRAAGAGLRAAGASFLPTVALAADYGFQGNRFRFTGENDLSVVSVVVQWNLFRSGGDAARVGSARLAAEQASTAQRDLAQRVELEVRAASEGVEVARASLAAARDRLAAATRTFELVRRRYQEGLAPHLEFSAARTEFTNAGLGEILARYTLVARQVELERAAALRTLTY